MSLPVVTPELLEAALANGAEIERIEQLSPRFDDMLAAFGEESLVREPNGDWSFKITREYWPAERNRARWGLFCEMMEKKRQAQTERSERLAEERNTVKVWANGETREIPAELEETIARKKGFHSAGFGRNLVMTYNRDKSRGRFQ